MGGQLHIKFGLIFRQARLSIGLVASVLVGVATCADAHAADAPPHAAERAQAPPSFIPHWQFYSAAYLWAAAVKGDARVMPPLPTSKVDVSFADSLKNIEGGIIATGFAHYNRFVVVADVIGSRSTSSQVVTSAGTVGELATVSKSLVTLGAVGYRFVDDARILVDGYVGARWWLMENSLSLYSPGLINAAVNKRKGWVDGLVGGQVRFNVSDHLYASAVGFVGAGGAKLEWDLYAGVGYRFNEKYEAYLGYRVLSVKYEKREFIYDITQHGPVIGLGVRF